MCQQEFYTKENEVKALLLSRSDMRQSIESWWADQGFGTPAFIRERKNVPMGIFARHVATARYEDIVFSLMARRAGLVPTWLEYTDDKFVSVSPYKRSLLHRQLCSGRGRKGGFRDNKVERLLDVTANDGKKISAIRVSFDEGLVEYHHRLQDDFLPKPIHRADISSWLRGIGQGNASGYYAAKLSMYVAHSVLFEDYHGGESGNELDNFTARVFEPAFAKITLLFGVKPLIVRMPWQREFGYYPANADWHTHGIVPDDLIAWRNPGA